MGIRFTNTLTRKQEPFKPLTPGEVRMYNCGPTVYSHAHIGNFRSFIFSDLLRRFLEFREFKVTQIMNITDVGHLTRDAEDRGEDKLEAEARRQKKDPYEISRAYTEEFFEFVDLLNIRRAHEYPRATDHIPEMLEMIKALIEKGFAYETNGNVYFDVTKFPAYGRLSGNTIDQLQAGARIEVRDEKRHPADFALWKQDPSHLMKWDSPWGPDGHPGWHAECSAMGMKYLGRSFDLHTGGEDNIFPHHESEIAQSEAWTGQPFVKVWMHARFLLVDGKKMSKSLGNFYTLNDLRDKGVDPIALRYELLSKRYREQQNFTFESLEASKKAVDRMRAFKDRLAGLIEADKKNEKRNKGVAKAARGAVTTFGEALDDDLNISDALSHVWEFHHTVNSGFASMDSNDAEAVLLAWQKIDSVLGVTEREEKRELDEESCGLFEQRNEARVRKDWETADRLRGELRKRGLILEDTKDGTQWRFLR